MSSEYLARLFQQRSQTRIIHFDELGRECIVMPSQCYRKGLDGIFIDSLRSY